MLRGWVLSVVLLGSPAMAEPVDDVLAAARAGFARMPTLEVVDQITGRCGADGSVNQQVAYCTSTNGILVAAESVAQPQAAYMVAHLLGHAIQVQHGVADVALRTIRSRPADEAVLRSYVVGQVECVAGFLYAQAGLPRAALTDWFDAEPFTGSHWGRDPLRVGPRVSVGLPYRDTWFQRGQDGDSLGVCAVGEFGAELLLRAYRG